VARLDLYEAAIPIMFTAKSGKEENRGKGGIKKGGKKEKEGKAREHLLPLSSRRLGGG